MQLHSNIVGVSVWTDIQGGRVSKDIAGTQGRPGLCLCWLGSSVAIWPHSCALPPSSSPVFPPLTASRTLASLDRNRSSILPQLSLQASLNRVAYAWVHTMHLSRNWLSGIDGASCRTVMLYIVEYLGLFKPVTTTLPTSRQKSSQTGR